MNHWCDKLADVGMKCEQWDTNVGLTVGRQFWLVNEDGVVHGKLKKVLKLRALKRYLEKYIDLKFGEGVARGLHYGAIIRAIQSAPDAAMFGKAMQLATAWLMTLDRQDIMSGEAKAKGKKWKKKKCPLCGLEEDSNAHALLRCTNEDLIAGRNIWTGAIRETIYKEKGLPENFKEALSQFFSTDDNGKMRIWDLDPQELELSDSDESDDEMDEATGREPSHIWLQSTEKTLTILADGANTELALRGWLPAHWQGALEDLGLDAVAAEAFLARIDKIIFDKYKEVWDARQRIIEPRTETQILRDERRKTSKRLRQRHTKLNMEIRGLIARNHELQGDKHLSKGWELRWTLPYKKEWVKQYGDKITAAAPAGKRKTRSGNSGTRDIRGWMTQTDQTTDGEWDLE